jgi:hypothetical protein
LKFYPQADRMIIFMDKVFFLKKNYKLNIFNSIY